MESTRILKYLGVMLDDKVSWQWHLKYIKSKAIAVLPKIAAIARNTFGYSSAARRVMLEGTVGALVQYASSCWAHVLMTKKNAGTIDQIHRLMLICYGRLYRTVSYLPCTVICGIPPMRLWITERAIIFSKKKYIELVSRNLLLTLLPWSSKDEMKADLDHEIMSKW